MKLLYSKREGEILLIQMSVVHLYAKHSLLGGGVRENVSNN
jgi:hypothetical protein